MWLVTRRQDHARGRARESATREQQRLERGRVQPVSVVDAHEHRPVSRPGEQERQRCCAREKAVTLSRRREAQRAGEHVALRKRQLGQPVQQRTQHLQQTGEGDLGLARDPGRPQDDEVRGRVHRVVEQRGLSDTRHASEQHRRAAAGPRRGYQRLQPRELGLPTHQHPASLTPPACTRREM